jgi:hypothetical protein
MQIRRPGNDMTGRHHRAQRECLVSVEKRGAVVKRLENQKLSLIIVIKHSAGGHLFVRSSGYHEKLVFLIPGRIFTKNASNERSRGREFLSARCLNIFRC